MKKQKRDKKRKPPLERLSLSLLILVVAVVLALLLYNSITRESRGFMSLRQDMVALQNKFNSIDKGWMYSESCRGKGGDFDRDVPSSCAASITNRSIDFSADHKNRVEAYSELIDKSIVFRSKGNISQHSQTFYFVVYDYREIQKPNCSLQSFADTESVKGNVSLTFGCIAESSKFYFERND